MRRRTLNALAALILAAVLAPARAAEPPDEATAPVERLTHVLLETMREGGTLGFDGRYDRLAEVLPEVFDFAFMARLSVGRHWEELDEAQRGTLIDRFAQLSIATFAARFDAYSGQRFEVLASREGPRGARLVPTRLEKPDGKSVAMDYLVRSSNGRWRAVDIYLAGKYSELASKRAEYTSVIEHEGFPALIDRLEARVAALRRGGAGQ